MKNAVEKRFADFDLKGRVFIVTGGAGGVGLIMAEALVEAGGKVHCLDCAEKPKDEWHEALQRVKPEFGGALLYEHIDVTDAAELGRFFDDVAAENQRLDGVIAAAGVMQERAATPLSVDEATDILVFNDTAVRTTARAAARVMTRYKCRGSICIVASRQVLIASMGRHRCVYDSSKRFLIPLARKFAMDWSPSQPDGTGGIRVNCLSLGYVNTPMVNSVLSEHPEVRQRWEAENMMHRLCDPAELKSAALFLLSNASSFMTGNNLVIDGGRRLGD